MKKLLLSFVVLAAVIAASGQDYDYSGNRDKSQTDYFSPSRFYYGGGLNLTFGSITEVGVSPMIGYKITPQFSFGSQLTYQYFKYDQGYYDYKATNYGASLFSRYRFIPQLYGHIEYSMMNYEFQNYAGMSNREWVPFLFVGGGFSQPIANNTWINAQLLFDVIQDENSPYDDWEPFYTIGIGVGF